MRLPRTRREKEIWHACETLWQQPPELRKLTGDAIQAQLLALNYKKGSPNEVYRYRKTWQETRGMPDNVGDAATALAASTLPDPINRAVSLVRDEIFSEAQQTLEKMTIKFNAEREAYEKEIKASQEQLDEIQGYNQKLHEEQQRLEAVCTAQHQEKILLSETINRLKMENQQLDNSLFEKMHEHALTLEKVLQGEKQLALMAETSEKQIALLKQTMVNHQENLIEHLKEQHHAQIMQYQETQLTLKDLMETQRHQWMKQLDAEKTAYKKLQLETNKITQLLDKSTQELVILQEKSIQYETLMELQKLQENLLSTLSAKVHNLERNISLDKISALFEDNTKGVSHHLSGVLQAHFQEQNEWLRNIVKYPIETESSA